MIPNAPALLSSSIAEAGAAYYLYKRIAYRRYPALMTYLVSESIWHAAGTVNYYIASRYSQPLRMGVRAWVVFEVLSFACFRLNRPQKARLCFELLSLSAAISWLFSIWSKFTPIQGFWLFRQYFHVILAAALWWVTVYLLRQEICENRDHRYYRFGMTAWFSNLAIACSIISREPASGSYYLLHVSPEVWSWCNLGFQLGITLTVLWLAKAMTCNISCLRPEVAFKTAGV